MKKYILILAAFVFALTVSSCSQSRLDIPQKGVVAEQDYYKTDEDCQSALAAVYAGLFHSPMRKFFTYFYAVNSELSDEVYNCDNGYKNEKSHWLMFYNGIDATHGYICDSYMALFALVYRCNLVIDNFKDGTSAIMKNAVAEAKVMRSFAYIFLTSLWGTPPLVDHVLRTADEYNMPNSTQPELWAFIINSLDEAINSGALQSKSNVNDKSVVRASKEFAMALKGKAQVFSCDYAGAKETLGAIIKSGKYALIPSEQLADLFCSSKGNNNCESIFESNIVTNPSNYKDVCTWDEWSAYNIINLGKFQFEPGSYWTQYSQTWNHWIPTREIITAMIENEGMQSARFKAWFYSYEDMQDLGLIELSSLRSESNREYLAKTAANPNKPDVNCPYATAADYCGENYGFWQRKLTMAPDEIYENSYRYDKVHRRWFRYAEVLLLYAEACAQLGETSGEGLEALNSIARRAGAPTYDKLTLDNVKNEKRFEMWGEWCRFIDVVRWGDAPTVFADHNNTLPVFFGYKPGKSREDINPDGSNLYDVYDIRFFDVETKQGARNQFTSKYALLPFPASEMAANQNLVQNPGWE